MGLGFDGLHLALRGLPVLRGVSGQLQAGAVTVILGPNGAGKSTLLNCLAGLRKADSGAVLLDGQPLHDMTLRDRARCLALLPQKAEVHWDIDVHTLVGLGRLPHHGRWGETEADRAAVQDAMAATDILHLAKRRAQQLSGGEQARALLARALAGQPAWLLADEPLANLDPAHQLDALARLTACAHSGMGVVLVLHDLSQAARVADQVILMQEGLVHTAGSVAQVLAPDPVAAVFGITVQIGHDTAGAPFLIPTGKIG